MKPMNKREEREYKDLSATFIGYLTTAFEEGKAKGWTEEQIREANPILFQAVDEIERISKIPTLKLVK